MSYVGRTALLIESVQRPDGLAVPFVAQTTSFSCGAASLLAVMRYWGVDGAARMRERDLFDRLGTNHKTGTTTASIVRAAKQAGLNVRVRSGATVGDLRAALRAGTTPILVFQAWPERKTRPLNDKKDGHYAVLVGLSADRAYFMDPSIGGGKTGWLPLDELQRAWIATKKGSDARRQAIFVRGAKGLGRRSISGLRRIETGRTG